MIHRIPAMILAFSLAIALSTLPTHAGNATLRADAVPWSRPLASSADLAAVAEDTLRAARAMGSSPAGTFATPAGDPLATLEWVVRVAAEDRATGADRLADPAFLARSTVAWRWIPDVPRPADAIRLTRYLVYSVPGRASADPAFPRALWAVPDDEAGLSADAAESRRDTLLRYRYSRQDIAAGVYLPGGASAGRATPLVWLGDEAAEQAQLQGTVAVDVPGEPASRLYNVHRSNGMPYDRKQTETRLQRRFWYFRAVDAVRGWAAEPVPGPALRPMVAVAGDLAALGFGRVLALRTADGLRLVVLADTGGAFEGNLHQLDLYSGIHPSRAAFDAATRSIGDTAEAWIVGVR